MAQHDVMKLLKKNEGKWLNIYDLVDKLDLTKNTIMSNLRKVKKMEKVESKYIKVNSQIRDIFKGKYNKRTELLHYRIRK